MANYPARERAKFSLKVASASLVLLKQEDRVDLIVLMAIGGARHITQYITVSHLVSMLDLNEKELTKHLNSIKKKGWILMEDNFIVLTEDGKEKERWIRYSIYRIYRKFNSKLKRNGRNDKVS